MNDNDSEVSTCPNGAIIQEIKFGQVQQPAPIFKVKE